MDSAVSRAALEDSRCGRRMEMVDIEIISSYRDGRRLGKLAEQSSVRHVANVRGWRERRGPWQDRRMRARVVIGFALGIGLVSAAGCRHRNHDPDAANGGTE